MISKNFSSRMSEKEFLSEAKYLGIAIESDRIESIHHYVDLESFFLAGTYSLHSSRITEGFLCWVLRYGHLLSPSKTRRLIQSGAPCDTGVLGGLISLIVEHRINSKQWEIVKPYTRKAPKKRALLKGPQPKTPNPHFLKYNIITNNFKMDQEKFLAPISSTYRSSIELKNRALFGSVVNADVASYLSWNPSATPYQVSKGTGNHKARVFDVHKDIKIAL